MVAATESAAARLPGFQRTLFIGTHPGVRSLSAEADSVKGLSCARQDQTKGAGGRCDAQNDKAAQVVAMAAQQHARRLDIVSYALFFVVIVVAAEVIVAALIW